MRMLRQINVQWDLTLGEAILPDQPKPFLLHSAFLSLSAGAAPNDRLPSLVINFGGVSTCLYAPGEPIGGGSEGTVNFYSWSRSGGIWDKNIDTGNSYSQVPIPWDLPIDSRFSVKLKIFEWDSSAKDTLTEASFLVEDLP